MKLIPSAVFLILFSSSLLYSQQGDFATVDFTKADSIAKLYPHHSLYELRSLAEKLTSSLPNDVEKFRSIYTWTCLNIDNDYELYAKNKIKREELVDPESLKKWNKEFYTIFMETLLKKHRTVCTGYAYVIRELSIHAGLSCEMINGYGRTAEANIGGQGIVNHSWNAIQLNNKWYLCDATWSSGSVNSQERAFIKKYDDCYFLLEPSLFIRNHYPSDSTWTLLDHNPTLHEFLNRPLVYKEIYKYKIAQLYPETFEIAAKIGKPISFQFRKNEKSINKIELQVIGPNGVLSATPSLQQDGNGLSYFSYAFKSRGTYTVHVLLNKVYAFTYKVEVRR